MFGPFDFNTIHLGSMILFIGPDTSNVRRVLWNIFVEKTEYHYHVDNEEDLARIVREQAQRVKRPEILLSLDISNIDRPHLCHPLMSILTNGRNTHITVLMFSLNRYKYNSIIRNNIDFTFISNKLCRKAFYTPMIWTNYMRIMDTPDLVRRALRQSGGYLVIRNRARSFNIQDMFFYYPDELMNKIVDRMKFLRKLKRVNGNRDFSAWYYSASELGGRRDRKQLNAFTEGLR